MRKITNIRTFVGGLGYFAWAFIGSNIFQLFLNQCFLNFKQITAPYRIDELLLFLILVFIFQSSTTSMDHGPWPVHDNRTFENQPFEV